MENVDLFAAGDRAVIDLATKPLETKPAAPTVAAPSVLTAPSPAAVTVPASSMETRIDDLLRNASAAMGPALRSNTQELHQAEVMRLEAEREMLLLDQQRLIERKVRIFSSISVLHLQRNLTLLSLRGIWPVWTNLCSSYGKAISLQPNSFHSIRTACRKICSCVSWSLPMLLHLKQIAKGGATLDDQLLE